MEAPGNIYFFQMLLLLLLMGVCTIWLGRLIQWLLLRKKLPRRKTFFILLHSVWVSYLLALLFWFFWPQPSQLMSGIFFLPAVLAELIILIITITVLKRGKHT